MKLSCATQNSAFKNHPRDILHDQNHLYGIVLVRIIHKTALNATKHLQVAGYNFFNKHQNSNFSLTASLTTVARLQAKRSSAQPLFYATITNSPVGCAFWGFDECRSSAPCLFFHLQSGCLSSLLGLSLLCSTICLFCSKICLLCFLTFPKFSAYYAYFYVQKYIML